MLSHSSIPHCSLLSGCRCGPGTHDEESRLAPSHSLLGSWQHLALRVQLPLENQHILFAFILIKSLPLLLYPCTLFLMPESCNNASLPLKLLHLLVWNPLFRLHICTLGNSSPLEIRNQLLWTDRLVGPCGSDFFLNLSIKGRSSPEISFEALLILHIFILKCKFLCIFKLKWNFWRSQKGLLSPRESKVHGEVHSMQKSPKWCRECDIERS